MPGGDCVKYAVCDIRGDWKWQQDACYVLNDIVGSCIDVLLKPNDPNHAFPFTVSRLMAKPRNGYNYPATTYAFLFATTAEP